jgi:hypothetical protein
MAGTADAHKINLLRDRSLIDVVIVIAEFYKSGERIAASYFILVCRASNKVSVSRSSVVDTTAFAHTIPPRKTPE